MLKDAYGLLPCSGHEAAGRIVAVGKSEELVGDRV